MPLATLLRPSSLDDFIGQERLLGKNGPIRKLIESNNIPSMIFWGPPASGKTTLAFIISKTIEADFETLSAVNSGKADLKKTIVRALENQKYGKKTILFIDEIHRWNKAQQDALLPYVESGVITLIGATTENPSFTVINALISRTRVFVFDEHRPEDVEVAVRRGIEFLNSDQSKEKSVEIQNKKEKIKEKKEAIKVEEDAVKFLSEIVNGDIRFALNSLELAANLLDDKKVITKEIIENAIQKTIRYDRNGEEHYNIISAVHKSLRNSNASASVYWVLRMVAGGEDPLYIARRLIRFASEDIGNVNPNALLLANVVYDTCKNIGLPECKVALVQLAKYLADSKKDNSAYTAMAKAEEDIQKYGELPVPLHFRNAPTKLMKDIGYSKGYEYDHDLKDKKSDQQAMPDKLVGKNYFAE